MKILEAHLPQQLIEQMESLVRDGWFVDTDEVVREAVRRFLDAHRPDLMAKFVRNDIEWGLHGEE